MRIYTKITAHLLYICIMLCICCFAEGQPPRGPIVISPQVHPDKKITFRYMAPPAKEVKLGGSQFGAAQSVGTEHFLYESVKKNIVMFEEKKINVKSFIVPGGHTWMNCKLFLSNTLEQIFKE